MARQYTTIALLAVALAVALFLGYKVSAFTAPMASKVVISFLIGACCSGLSGYHRHVRVDPHQYPRRERRPFEPWARTEDCIAWRLRNRTGSYLVVAARCRHPLFLLRWVAGPGARALSTRWLWLRRFAGGTFCPVRWRHLHQSRRRGRGPGGQGRGGDPRRRSPQSRGNRRPGGRQCRRLCRPRRGYL